MLIPIAILATSLIISYVNRPKPPVPRPASMQDFDMPVVEEGAPQSVFFGDCWLAGWQVLNYGQLRTSPIKSSGGGKK